MLQSTVFSVLAMVMPLATAIKAPQMPIEPPQTPIHASLEKAFKFGYTSDKLPCYQIEVDTWIPDGKCLTLPGKILRVGKWSPTCRVFIYMNRDCTGKEYQLWDHPGQSCFKTDKYYSMKAFCG